MSKEILKKTFARNLNYFLALNGLKQKDLADYMGVSSSTVSDWCNGVKIPRMDKIQSIANWLGVELSDLLEDNSDKQEQGYYLDEQTKQIAQEIYERPELKILFDAAKNVKAEDLEFVKELLLKLAEKEGR